MNIEKVIRVTITNEEYKALKKAEQIFDEICQAIGNDCALCPLHNVCGNYVCQSAPSTMLNKYISALFVED